MPRRLSDVLGGEDLEDYVRELRRVLRMDGWPREAIKEYVMERAEDAAWLDAVVDDEEFIESLEVLTTED